ncbi:hypothetical protein BH11PSE3_BH11PSE3_18160 [soil metagenome]
MSFLVIVQIGCLIVFALLLIVAGWQDLHTMHISDAIPLAIAGSFLVWALSGWARGTVTPAQCGGAVLAAVAIFVLAAFAFAARALGGGDVKLLAAASLFAGPTSLMLDYLLVTALAGGLLALALLAGLPIGPSSSAPKPPLRVRLRGRLPYGPAIAAGGLWIVAERALV